MHWKVVAVLALACGGCRSQPLGGGSGDPAPAADMTAASASPADLAPARGGGAIDQQSQIFVLRSGSYSVSNLKSAGADSCMQNLTPANFSSLNLINDGHGGMAASLAVA